MQLNAQNFEVFYESYCDKVNRASTINEQYSYYRR